MKDIFILKPTQYFGLNEILSERAFGCELVALEENTILLTINKTDIFTFFTQQEIVALKEDYAFNVTFLEDIDLMNDVWSDIQSDKMKFNALVFSSNL